MQCAYCDRLLICDGCGKEWQPASEEAYHAMEQRDVPVICPDCEAVLVCHWCKTPYDGMEEAEVEEGD